MSVDSSNHIYLSTSCLHNEHGYCAGTQRQDGETKTPACCKWCGALCVCICHRPWIAQLHARMRSMVVSLAENRD